MKRISIDTGPSSTALPLLSEPALLPLTRAYAYLRLAGVASPAAAAAMARLQSRFADAGPLDPDVWWRELAADPVWSDRRTIVVRAPPALGCRKCSNDDDPA